MTSRRKRVRRLLRWNRWIAHYPSTIAAPPAAVRAYKAAYRVQFQRLRDAIKALEEMP